MVDHEVDSDLCAVRPSGVGRIARVSVLLVITGLCHNISWCTRQISFEPRETFFRRYRLALVADGVGFAIGEVPADDCHVDAEAQRQDNCGAIRIVGCLCRERAKRAI